MADDWGLPVSGSTYAGSGGLPLRRRDGKGGSTPYYLRATTASQRVLEAAADDGEGEAFSKGSFEALARLCKPSSVPKETAAAVRA